MTINKAQGQTFEKIGLYLPEPCFGYGQFYTACSRVTSFGGFKTEIKEHSRQGTISNVCVTDNIVYQEILSK